MDLIIGGYAAGKLNFALEKLNNEGYSHNDIQILNEEVTEFANKSVVIINHFHIILKKFGAHKARELCELAYDNFEKIIVISDEIGCGIIPANKDERDYRDQLGHELIFLAKRADSVERIICGIPQKIK